MADQLNEHCLVPELKRQPPADPVRQFVINVSDVPGARVAAAGSDTTLHTFSNDFVKVAVLLVLRSVIVALLAKAGAAADNTPITPTAARIDFPRICFPPLSE